MGKFLKKIKKNIDEKEKYSYISVEDLEKLKCKALELADKLKQFDIISQQNEYKECLKEYIGIVSDLKKYKKYAKK